MEWIIVIGLLIAMWVIALVPVEKLSKNSRTKEFSNRNAKRTNALFQNTQ